MWIIYNQKGRRNLPIYEHSKLALRLEALFRDKATQGKRNNLIDNFLENSPKSSIVNTRQELAKIAGVSDNTIARVKVIEEKAPEEVKQKVVSGEVSVNTEEFALSTQLPLPAPPF